MSEDWRSTGRFLVGVELFDAISVAQTLFRLDGELPSLVFRSPIDSFVATDVLHAAGGDFAHVLNTLCGAFGDLWCAVLLRRAHDDDLVAGFRFDSPPSAELLWARLNYEPDGDVIRSYTSAAASWVFFGSSGQWGCWADRNWELAIVGTSGSISLGSQDVPFQTVIAQLRATLEMSGGSLSPEDESAFTTNFA
jgi:hypothetical protein